MGKGGGKGGGGGGFFWFSWNSKILETPWQNVYHKGFKFFFEMETGVSRIFKDFQGMFSFFWRDKEDIRCISAGSNEEQLGYTSAAGMLWMVASRRS